jgi:hypothetical protein
VPFVSSEGERTAKSDQHKVRHFFVDGKGKDQRGEGRRALLRAAYLVKKGESALAGTTVGDC